MVTKYARKSEPKQWAKAASEKWENTNTPLENIGMLFSSTKSDRKPYRKYRAEWLLEAR